MLGVLLPGEKQWGEGKGGGPDIGLGGQTEAVLPAPETDMKCPLSVIVSNCCVIGFLLSVCSPRVQTECDGAAVDLLLRLIPRSLPLYRT